MEIKTKKSKMRGNSYTYVTNVVLYKAGLSFFNPPRISLNIPGLLAKGDENNYFFQIK